MKKIVLLLFFFPLFAKANTYYISTFGSDSNPGTISSTWLTLSHAESSVSPGDVVLINNGTYTIGYPLSITHSVTSGNLISFKAINPGNVILNGSVAGVPDIGAYEYQSAIGSGNIYYVAPTGNNSNAGTIGSPWHDFDKLSSAGLQPGDIVYFRGGTYRCSKSAATDVRFSCSGINGSSGNPIKLWAYPGENPVFDFDDVLCTAGAVVGFKLDNSSYVHFKGLRFTGLAQNPDGNSVWVFLLSGSPNCIVENCTVDNSAMYGFTNYNSNNTLFLNCDAHDLSDQYSPEPWGGSNGFNTGQNGNTSTGVILRGCRAWWCSDDGYDCFRASGANGTTIFDSCWAFWNGYRSGTFATGGDGEGFKLGPNPTVADATLLKTVQNCLSFQNRGNGFDQNAARCIINYYNNTSYQNGFIGFKNQNLGVRIVDTARNNVSYLDVSPQDFRPEVIQDHNSWSGFSFGASAFVSLDTTGITGARQADGSLPAVKFLKLVPNSKLINAGVDVGLPFSGSLPDLGAFENTDKTTKINRPMNINSEKNSGFFISRKKIFFIVVLSTLGIVVITFFIKLYLENRKNNRL